MGIQLGSAFGKVVIDASGVQRGVQQATGALSGFQGTVRRVMEFAGGQLVARGFTALTSGLSGLGRESILAAARVQEMDGVMHLMGDRAGYSAEGIDDATASIRELGIRTDVAQGLVTQFVRYELDLADAVTLARTAQDAAVISMEDSSDALDGLLHGVLTQNSLVMRNHGINLMASDSMDAYAESIGKTAGELDETERIQAMLNGTFAEGERIAGAYEAAMDAPGKRMRSLSRYGYELRVALGEPLLNAFAGVIDLAGNFTKSLTTAAQEGGWLREVLVQVGEGLTQLLSGDFSALANLLPPEVAENVQLFLDGLRPVGDVLRNEILPAVMEFLPTLQEWAGQLLVLASGALPVLAQALQFVAEHWREFAAGLAAVGAILAGAQIVAGIAAVVAAIAAIANPITLVVGAVALLAAAWAGNWGGIRDTLLGVWAAMQPTLETLWTWLATNIPLAIKVLKGFWTNTLLPAMQAVGSFIETVLLPVYRAVADVMRAVVGKALEWLAAYFTNKMVPAIKATWKVIDELLVPVIKVLLGPALLWLKDSVLGPLAGAFDGIGGAIKSVVDWLKRLADNIRGIELPDWLTPGSPTPFELGLLGIADAMRGLAAVEVPRLAGAFGGALAPAAVGGGGGYGDYRSYPVTVQVERVGDDVDIEVLAYRVAEEIGRRV